MKRPVNNTQSLEDGDSPEGGGVDSEPLFLDLHRKLLGDLLAETETIKLRPALRQAANEAAALAWSTPFPLLVFPQLFIEKTSGAKVHEIRQQKVLARSPVLQT